MCVRAARKFVFGENATGTPDDLARFTDTDGESITHFGRSDPLGEVVRMAHAIRFLGVGGIQGRQHDHSERGVHDVGLTIGKLAVETHDRVRSVLSDCRADLVAGEALLGVRASMSSDGFSPFSCTDAALQMRTRTRTVTHG
jgi:ATP-dependent Zn protease